MLTCCCSLSRVGCITSAPACASRLLLGNPYSAAAQRYPEGQFSLPKQGCFRPTSRELAASHALPLQVPQGPHSDCCMGLPRAGLPGGPASVLHHDLHQGWLLEIYCCQCRYLEVERALFWLLQHSPEELSTEQKSSASSDASHQGFGSGAAVPFSTCPSKPDPPHCL